MGNKTALITGANSGIGLETAKALALQNYDLILVVRTQVKADETVKLIQQINPAAKIDTYIADLNNLDTVKAIADKINKKYSIIDCIICNAGIGPNTVEFHNNGLEESFVTNHLSHFVLVNKLIPQVDAASDGRVISVASSAFKMGKVARMFLKKNDKMNALQAYGDSKLANVLFTKALAAKLQKARAFSLHPGVVKSGFGANYTGLFKLFAIVMRPFMISTVKGAQTSIYLATTPLRNIESFNSGYFEKSKPVAIKYAEVTAENAIWLWDKSAEAVGI
jgi:retinol dehydrogenase 12